MNIALVLSGGQGTRLKSAVPKQYIDVGGQMIVTRTLSVFYRHEAIDAVQIVAAEAWRETLREEQARVIFRQGEGLAEKFRGFSRPGETRQLSISNGLRDIAGYAEETDIVVVHDAARPLVSAALLSAGLGAMGDHDGVMPVLAMKDTVYESVNRVRISKLLNREHIFAGQAPEFFRFGRYRQANEALSPEEMLKINGATEPAILSGLDVAMIPGEEQNFKITTPADLERYREIMERGQA